MKIINYIVKSAIDQDISESRKQRKIDEFILAGAELGGSLFDGEIYRDNVGVDNISSKNRKYCELTALYWIWKNSDAIYIGLEHYRRAFTISEEDVLKMLNQGIDAIIPEKLKLGVSVEKQYKSTACNDVWDAMMDVIEQLYPYMYTSAQVVFSDDFIYPYNMIICKKEFIDTYCRWLFPILFRIEELVGTKWDMYQERYPGFIAERLFTLFIRMHTQDFHIIESPVKLYQSSNYKNQGDSSEEEIIKYIWQNIEKRKGNAAWFYLSNDIGYDTIKESPKLTHIYKVLKRNFEDNLSKGDTYIIRDCKSIEDLLAINI